MKYQNKAGKRQKDRGMALLLVLFLMALGVLLLATLNMLLASLRLRDVQNRANEAKALYLAESGMQDALWYLNNQDRTWTGTGASDDPAHYADFPIFVLNTAEHAPERGEYTVESVVDASGVLALDAILPDDVASGSPTDMYIVCTGYFPGKEAFLRNNEGSIKKSIIATVRQDEVSRQWRLINWEPISTTR